jgi:hypothetical protein
MTGSISILGLRAGRDVRTLTSDRHLDGIFAHLVDRMTFIDRVDLSVWGTRRKVPKSTVSILQHFPIAGPGRLYGHSNHGICQATRNTFEQRFGVLRWPRRVPPLRFIFYSNGTPLTCANVDLVLDAMMRRGYRTCLSRVELTFDLSKPSFDFFRARVVTAARKLTFRSNARGRFFSAGTRNSPWQLVVYEKPPVVRFELILRRQFLRNMGINLPHEIVWLRTLGLRRLVRVQEPESPTLAEDSNMPAHVLRTIRSWAKRFPTRQFTRALRGCGRRPDDWLMPCPVERKIRRMQGRLVW